MPTVKFTDPDEFLSELETDSPLVERGIVRLTIRHRRTVPLSSVTVVASFVAADRVVRMESYRGEYMPGMGEERRVIDDAKAVRDKIESAARKWNLTVRPGVFED